MKTQYPLATCLLLTVMMLTSHTLPAATTSELLQQGLYAEEVEGNIDLALDCYRQVVQDQSAPASQVAQALYRQGMCYLKIQDDRSARAALQNLVANYPGQTELVEKARPVLRDLAEYDPALLMPANTLLYLELGSPGDQIETILGLLEGTPYENPMAALGSRSTGNSTEKSPMDILAALLNPGMAAESKKIRSTAIGITGIGQNHPDMIAVIYPGRSDALRGIILAALGIAGNSSEAIEGMQRVNLPEDMAVAYDDNVILCARPARQLEWSVKQYKGLSSEPNLATGNKTFIKLSRSLRQKNAVTLWAKVDAAYARLLELFPAGQIPSGIVSANAILDFANMDELIWTDSLDPAGLGSELNIHFKDGHECRAYNLIRTPHITTAALKAVPAEAIALVSFSLSQAAEGPREQVQSAVQNVTGLDIGRELFNNLEQVSLFAMPDEGGGSATSSARGALPAHLALVLTSRNPDQTQEVLSTLMNTMSGGQPSSQPGRYRISPPDQPDRFCFMEQADSTTLLSMNRAIIDRALAAIHEAQSVTASGPLNEAVASLPPSASKLALVNLGGAIRLLRPQITPANLNEEQLQQYNSSLDQLARAGDGITLEIRTDEEDNRFSLSSSVQGIPPLRQLMDPAMQIARITEQANAQAKTSTAQRQLPALILPATQAPIIDGNEDEAWLRAPRNTLGNVITSFASGEKASPPASSEDLSADFRALWDEEYLYLLVDVTDDRLVNDTSAEQPIVLPSGSSAVAWWYDDSVEVYLDADNAKPDQYGEKDAHYHFDWDRNHPTMGYHNVTRDIHIHNHPSPMDGIEFAMVTTEKGYRTEIKFPWTTLGTKPSAGATIGFDVHVNDDDDGMARDRKITWHDTHDTAWENPQSFGNGLLGGLVGWWKFDETEGRTAQDSSGGNHNGMLMGNAQWASGERGGALELDGSDSYVRVEDDSAFDMADQMTLACWVNFRAIHRDHTAIVTKGDGSWRLSTAAGGTRFHMSVDNWQRVTLDGEIEVPIGEWHHVAAVYDGKSLSLYVDGELDTTKLWTGPIARNDFDVLIGENDEVRGRLLDGWIDDTRVYNYALSEEEIQTLVQPQ